MTDSPPPLLTRPPHATFARATVHSAVLNAVLSSPAVCDRLIGMPVYELDE